MAAGELHDAFVLHTRRYGDSSLLVDLFSRSQGRVACIAKGALQSRRSDTRLQPFQALKTEMRGRGEVLTLVRAEGAAPPLRLGGRDLYCGLYLNELVLKLTARQDPMPMLFDDYAVAITALSDGQVAERVLRRFEVRLLSNLGLGLDLDLDTAGRPIVADSSYTYHIDGGAERSSRPGDQSVSGRTLLGLRDDRLDDEDTMREARLLMRRVINHHLDGRPLRSRELFR